MDRPKICVVITAPNIARAVETMENSILHEPDLIEVRLDYMDNPERLSQLRNVTDIPLIATNRLPEQGGFWKGSEKDRIKVILSACEAGFDYVDLELIAQSVNETVKNVEALGARTIISHHDYKVTPCISDLDRILREELDAGADVCKIIGMAKDYRDGLTYLQFLSENHGIELVSFGMGEMGVISRIFSPIFGGAYTYASVDVGEESASGQLTISDLKRIYEILGV